MLFFLIKLSIYHLTTETIYNAKGLLDARLSGTDEHRRGTAHLHNFVWPELPLLLV